MAKQFKLNIKNAQLAAALTPVKKETLPPASKAEEENKDALPKRRTRLVQAPTTPPIEEPISVTEESAFVVAEDTSFTPQSHTPPATESRSAAEQPRQPAAEARPTAPAPAPAAPRPPSRFPVEPAQPARNGLPAPKDLRLQPKRKTTTSFDARDRQGLRSSDDEAWRKMRHYKNAKRSGIVEEVVRPKSLKVRIPITVKDLAQEMKLKASQLVSKLFMKGLTLTLNDSLDDETIIQLLGHDFDCDIQIDTSEQERIRITDQTIRQEISQIATESLILRPPVVAFMGHVDHGKTSLIDAIRKSNRAALEAGAITQHIGAFKVSTPSGDVAILDTPGHEAFSEMRSRGANVTDIVILVVAGDEGIRAQTDEAIRQAREAKVPILVAINKSDKPNFDPQIVYRELADRELLPEAWGGTTITVPCSALTGKGVPELLEMIALQAEILELRADPETRARGTVLESEMHKGMGPSATVLVQNGTLRRGDAIVFGHFFGRVKTMQDEFGRALEAATPSTPVKITGLSELPLAGEEFIVVKNEKEARELAEARVEGHKRSLLKQTGLTGMEKMMQKRGDNEAKVLPLVLRADVQGSLEALRNSLMKIHSKKVRLEIVDADVGAISESDVALAAASKATIIGFHTSIESRAQDLIKQTQVAVFSQDIIYHLVDEVRLRMRSLLDKLEEEQELGEAEVKAVFKSSQVGLIAGCQVTEGVIKRQARMRQIRGKETIWKGDLASLKRVKEDVKEVQKGFECGIVLQGQNDVQAGDRLQAYEIIYIEQEL
jgi:translation initiation factor IF-2